MYDMTTNTKTISPLRCRRSDWKTAVQNHSGGLWTPVTGSRPSLRPTGHILTDKENKAVSAGNLKWVQKERVRFTTVRLRYQIMSCRRFPFITYRSQQTMEVLIQLCWYSCIARPRLLMNTSFKSRRNKLLYIFQGICTLLSLHILIENEGLYI